MRALSRAKNVILLELRAKKLQSNVAGNQTTNVTIIQAQPKNPQILEFQGGNTGGGDEGKPCQQIKIGKSTGGITPGADKLVGGSQVNDCLYGRGGNDWLIGDGGNDQLFGEDGNDKLEGGDGSDLADGGDGNDDVLGGAQNDILYGGTGNDGVYGFEGDEKLSGGPGNDVLVDVHGGADQFICGAGIDKIYGYKQSEGDTKDDCEQILEVIPPN